VNDDDKAMEPPEDNQTRLETVYDNVASVEVSEALDLRINEDPWSVIANLKAQLAAERQETEAQRQKRRLKGKKRRLKGKKRRPKNKSASNQRPKQNFSLEKFTRH